jgi:cytochrome c biogenesis protein CcmG, thiol:disulfide interchange protein DsbE
VTTSPALLRSLFAALAIASCFIAGAGEVGKPAPDILLRGSDGKEQKLSSLQGKVVYLDFWASWCGPCRESFPWMNQMQERFAGQDVVVLAVNLDAKGADADAFLARYPAKFRVAFDSDGTSAKQLGVKAMPTSFIIGRDGTLIAEHRGFRDAQKAAVEREIQAALQK